MPDDRKASLSQTIEALKDILCGSIAGSTGKVIEYPFDTVKVRLQSQSLQAPTYTGPLDCFRQSIQAHGIFQGLYRGISAPLLGAAIETSSLFFSYRIAQDFYLRTIYRHEQTRKHLPLNALIVCGAASGAFTSILLTPIELIKCQMQISTNTAVKRPGVLSIVQSVMDTYGLRGFWRGQLGTLIRETGGSAAWFGAYEGMSLMWRSMSPQHNPDIPLHQQLLSGALAGIMYNFVFFPADTIKSRMQTEHVHCDPSRPPKRQSFWATGKTLWTQQGLRGLYHGCGITVFRSAPSSAFIFVVYEKLRTAAMLCP